MIIRSLLDTDLYKFSMMQVVLHHYPAAQVEYRFKCRNPGIDLVPYIGEIRAELDALCSLRFSEDELAYLRSWRFIKSDFIDFLGLFQLNAKYVSIEPASSGNGEIEIRIVGPWLHTILFEVPLLAIVNEVYFRNAHPGLGLDEGRERLRDKIALLRDTPGYEGCRIADYGTRRRFSREWHAEVVEALRDGLGPKLAGTSNVWLAWKLGLTPLGTLAHAVEQQRAVQHAVTHVLVSEQAGRDAVVRAQLAQCQRGGEQLGGGRGLVQAIAVVLVERAAGVQRDHRDAPARAGKARLRDLRFDAGGQRQRFAGVCRGAEQQRCGHGEQAANPWAVSQDVLHAGSHWRAADTRMRRPR